MEEMEKRVGAYAVENGLIGPFTVHLKVESFGFSAEVQELTGKQRSAHMNFLKDGSPSLYELTSRER